MPRRPRTAGTRGRRRRRISDRVFFLDDEDRALVDRRRGTHMRVGFALQLVTVRWLGTFLEEPLDVPGAVLDFVAGQLGVADPSLVKRYTERTKTRFDHQWEIRRAYGLREFVEIEAEFTDWVAARSWTSGDGPKAIFLDGMTWLRDRKVLLPGVTTLARLVAKRRHHTPPHAGCGSSWKGCRGRASAMSWTSYWRSRRDHGRRIWSGGARAHPRAAAARQSSRHWTRWRRSWRWGWPIWAPRRGCRRGGWVSWPGTG